mmetsp:Transcript_32457/g.85717  ORF Transcript_32457/g.85717 Transcript_32457/m.85717 type:complete len:343 (-) Transcript_32457:190-1218(-)
MRRHGSCLRSSVRSLQVRHGAPLAVRRPLPTSTHRLSVRGLTALPPPLALPPPRDTTAAAASVAPPADAEGGGGGVAGMSAEADDALHAPSLPPGSAAARLRSPHERRRFGSGAPSGSLSASAAGAGGPPASTGAGAAAGTATDASGTSGVASIASTARSAAGTCIGRSAVGHSAFAAPSTSPAPSSAAACRKFPVTSVMRRTKLASSSVCTDSPRSPIWIERTSGVPRVTTCFLSAVASISRSGSHCTTTGLFLQSPTAVSLCESVADMRSSSKRARERSSARTRACRLSFMVVHPQRYAIQTADGLIHVIRTADQHPAFRGASNELAATARSAISSLYAW